MMPYAYINAYLILKKNNQILMQVRSNTGFLDGYYSLVSGHVEDEESALTGVIREAEEECGISIAREDVSVVHVMHRMSDRSSIDIFFQCDKFQGEPYIAEPDKCSKLEFIELCDIPDNTIDYIRVALDNINNNVFYSQFNWSEGE